MKLIVQRSLVFLVVLALLLSGVVKASDSERTYDSIDVFSDTSAHSFLLMDGFTGSVIASKNADQTLPMASTTKIMTCLIALERGTLSDIIAIPKEAVGVEGSSVYLVKDEKLSLEELLFALMLESANDAAVAIALYVSDDIPSFAELMNQKAKELGMKETSFANPHGLPSEGHYSSARDLCKLLSYAMQNEAFRVFSGTKSISISGPNSSRRYLSNHNKLLRIYDPCVGGKTGFTKEAGRCLVSAAEQNGRMLICATLGDPNDWLDHVTLFRYGFSLYEKQKVLLSNEISEAVPVVGGTKDKVYVTNVNEYEPWIRIDEKVERIVELPAFLYADVKKDQTVGYVVYTINGKEAARFELIAKENVSKRKDKLSFWKKIVQNIKLWMD